MSTHLDIAIIEWILVLRVDFSTWTPLLWCNQLIVEDLIGVDIYEADISTISDSTTIVGCSNQVLDGLPRDGSLLVVRVDWSIVLQTAHVIGKCISAHLPIRIVERICVVPAERLELLTLEEQRMEPAKTKDSLAEGLRLVTWCERCTNISVQTGHVWFDTTRWLDSHLH